MYPSTTAIPARIALALAAAAALYAATPVLADAALRAVNERVPADPKGTVEIENVAGKVTLAAWDRAEVAVSGTIGPRVEKVEVTSSPGRTVVHVRLPSALYSSGRDGSATLTVYVPRESAASVSLVSADLVVSGVRGFESLHTVSGNVIGEVGGEANVKSVSGDIDLEAPSTLAFEAQTVSGNIKLHGASEQLRVTSVSGDAKLSLGTFSRAHLESVSGDVSLLGVLGAGGELVAQTISGDLRIDFAGAVPGGYDVRTLSGEIRNCFGPKAVRPQYGPGARATFREGEGSARIDLETKSGDVYLCNQGVLKPAPVAVSRASQAPEPRGRQYAFVW